ncbi:MAG TPA: hypothetical protein VMV26_04095 [Alphaproteobacteria bacterium]|jgi:hypothetical protein|nr:hypothetical protein [Alphaproteobacteria bacterium]
MSGRTMLVRALVVLLVAAVTACTTPKSAPAPLVETPDEPTLKLSALRRHEFGVGKWLGTSYSPNGRLDRCVVSARFAGVHYLYFSLDRDRRFGLAFGTTGWTLTLDERHPIAYVVDDHHYAAMATAIYKELLLVDEEDTALLFPRFLTASMLTIDTLGGRFAFKLEGIGAALDALQNCVDRNLRTEGGATATAEARPSRGASNPFARSDGPAAERRAEGSEGGGGMPSNPFVRPGGDGPQGPRAGGGNGIESRDAPGSQYQHTAPDAIAAARRFVERLLTAADIADYRILVGPEAPTDKGDVDVIWRMGDQTGTLRIVEPRRYPSVVEASAAIVRDASLICNEGFTSSIAARTLRDGRPAAQMSVACTRPLTWHANYTVVPVNGAGYYRVNLTSFGDPREIDALQERIGRALPRVVPEG